MVHGETLTNAKGAYLLLIELDTTLELRIGTLPPGRYAYCGSAHGPGGIAARVGRHLRRDKALRWHVDHLTGAGRVVAVHARPGGRECDLFARVSRGLGVRVPVPGFGSSDCRHCPAHLVAVPDGFDIVQAFDSPDGLRAESSSGPAPTHHGRSPCAATSAASTSPPTATRP